MKEAVKKAGVFGSAVLLYPPADWWRARTVQRETIPYFDWISLSHAAAWDASRRSCVRTTSVTRRPRLPPSVVWVRRIEPRSDPDLSVVLFRSDQTSTSGANRPSDTIGSQRLI